MMESKPRPASSSYVKFLVRWGVFAVGGLTFLLFAISAPDIESIRTAFVIHAGVILTVYPLQFLAMGKVTAGEAVATSLPGLTMLAAAFIRLFIVDDVWAGLLMFINFGVFTFGTVVIYRLLRRPPVQ